MRRVLAIDGGGIKGVFPAAFLALVEHHIEGNVGDYFDLICGTSTGGIIALGLASELPADVILQLYRDNGQAIFGSPRGVIGRLTRPKYSAEPLLNALRDHLGDRTLEQCTRRVVVPTQMLETGDVYIYKTPHHPRLHADLHERVVDVAAATTAAPTYFPAHRTQHGSFLIDGGTWANNPAGVAAVEAVGLLGWEARETKLLSLGCTSEPLTAKRVKRGRGGRAAWTLDGLNVLMAGQSSAAMGTARVLLGGENVYRVSPVVANDSFGLDGVEHIDRLRGLAQAEWRNEGSKLREVFFQAPAEPFIAPSEA